MELVGWFRGDGVEINGSEFFFRNGPEVKIMFYF